MRVTGETTLKTSTPRPSILACRSEPILYPRLLLGSEALAVDSPPPFMVLVAALSWRLIPRLRAQNIVNVLDLIVLPDLVMHTLRPHRLQRIVDIRQSNPASPEDVAQQRLVCEVIVHGGLVGQLVENKVVHRLAGVDNLQAAVGHTEASGWPCTSVLCGRGVGVLRCEGAVLGDPVLRVVRLLQRVAYTCMACREDLVALSTSTRRVEFHLHQLIHVVQDQHVAVQLHDAVIVLEGERCQLTPAVVEARVVGVVLRDLGQQVLDMFFGDAALIQGSVAFGGEGVGVERDEGVFAAVLFQAVVEGEEACQVGCVGDQRGPHFSMSAMHLLPHYEILPFFDSIGADGVACVADMSAASVCSERNGSQDSWDIDVYCICASQ
jgi:hypothetical protein